LIGESHGVKVYDDYAHHPTAIAATIAALKQKHPSSRIWAVLEAHSYSRTKALLSNYRGVFKDADRVIVGPVFKARDKEDFGISGQSIVDIAGHKDAIYLTSLDQIVKKLKAEVKFGDVILVMGAGESYKWAREILNSLNNIYFRFEGDMVLFLKICLHLVSKSENFRGGATAVINYNERLAGGGAYVANSFPFPASLFQKPAGSYLDVSE